MTFAERLKQLRKENDLTQEEFAMKISKTRSTIAGYETERKEPDYETLKLIAKNFNISIDYLLGESDIRTPEPQTADEKLRALLSDPDMRVAFQDYESWTDEEKKDLIEYIEFKRSKREKK